MVVALVLAVDIAWIADQNRSITDVAQGGPAVNHSSTTPHYVPGHGRDANPRGAGVARTARQPRARRLGRTRRCEPRANKCDLVVQANDAKERPNCR